VQSDVIRNLSKEVTA